MSYINNLNTHNGRIGKLGEDFASEFLINKGFDILERNFRTKIGEIDIICKYKNKIHIVEVKTSMSNSVRAIENMNAKKLKKVALLASLYTRNQLYCIDFIGVSLNSDYSLKNIEHLENLEI